MSTTKNLLYTCDGRITITKPSSVRSAWANAKAFLISSSVTGLLFEINSSYDPLLTAETGSPDSTPDIDSNRNTSII